MSFERLTKNVYVMRCIALHKPNAHRAFLYHAAYREQYNTQGGTYELACVWGVWVISCHCMLLTAKYDNKYNFRHPLLTSRVHYRFCHYDEDIDYDEYIWYGSQYIGRKTTHKNGQAIVSNMHVRFWCNILHPYWEKNYVHVESLVNYEILQKFLVECNHSSSRI